MIVYILMVSLLYCFINYMLLIGTARLFRRSIVAARCLLGALFGSIYVFISLLWNNTMFSIWWAYLLSVILISVIAYGVSKSWLAVSVSYTLFNILLGGVDVGTRGMIPLLLGTAGVFLICTIARNYKDEIIPVEIYHLDKIIKINALRDTGNMLKDPVTGQAVLVVGADVALKLTGLSQMQLRSPIKCMEQTPGLRLIPYKTISEQGKFLLAKNMEKVKIGNWQGSVIIAFSPELFSSNGRFQALMGGNL